jgi:hypothetical protein
MAISIDVRQNRQTKRVPTERDRNLSVQRAGDRFRVQRAREMC